MVMREGMAWGLMMRSGTMPSRVKGMSSCVYVMPTVPFWPWRDANLSPTCGTRIVRVRTLTNFASLSGVLVIITWSTTLFSCALRPVEQSDLVFCCALHAPTAHTRPPPPTPQPRP